MWPWAKWKDPKYNAIYYEGIVYETFHNVKRDIGGYPSLMYLSEVTAVQHQKKWKESHEETSIYLINNLSILLANTGTSLSEVIQ